MLPPEQVKLLAKTLYIYDDRLKLLSSFSAIGPAGVSALEATGYDMNDPSNTYIDSLTCLEVINDRKETIFVSIQRFLLTKQKVGEGGLNYLLRVEKCSRKPGYNSPTDVNINAEIPEASGPIKGKVRKLMVCVREADHIAAWLLSSPLMAFLTKA